MIEPMKIAAMVADLKEGVLRMGMHEDNSTELFDIDGANDLMLEGGNMLEALTTENATLRASEAAAVARVGVKPLAFGTGALVIDTGSYGGKPAVFVSPAKYPGEIGASATRENHPLDSLVDGDMVMTFPTDVQAKVVADALCNAITPAPEPQPAARDVLAERQRQISAEGWTPEHDDQHDCCELALVAALYASPIPLFEESREEGISTTFSDPWPESWDDEWDRREDFDDRRKLVIAGALILAEIERLDRAALRALAGKEQP